MKYSPFRHIDSAFWKRRPIQLTYFVTRACNANCPFCFYLSRKEKQKEPELTLPEIRRISGSIGPLLWLAFSGGEVFLREDLPDIAEVFYKQNTPSIILLPTNGLMPERIFAMTETILKRCPKSTVVVKLSLDGPEEIHDSLRGVPGAFRKVLETRQLLARLLGRHPNFELGVNSVICSRNQSAIPGLIDFVKTLPGVSTHTVSHVRGDVQDETLKAVDHKRYAEVSRLLERDLKTSGAGAYRFMGSGLKAAQDILQRRLIHKTMQEDKRIIPCYAGKLTLVLTESGDVYPCESFDQNMGNVREYDCNLGKLLKSGLARNAIDEIRQGDCFCSHECYMMMNILFNPRLYPCILKEYLQVVS